MMINLHYSINAVLVLCFISASAIIILTHWTFSADDSHRAYHSSTPLRFSTLNSSIQAKIYDPPHCDELLSGQADRSKIKEAKAWKDEAIEILESRLKVAAANTNPEDFCSMIKKNFIFNDKPLSTEEENYPLAYGMIIYKDIVQAYRTLSSFYHPQHAYCVAVDGKSDKAYKHQIAMLSKCFPNIIVYASAFHCVVSLQDFMAPIDWCSPNVAHALLDCFEILANSNHPWKYYQYITAFDVPLKTNLEMIRIFKQFNDAVIAEVTFGGNVRADRPAFGSTKLRVWKSGMSALVSRRAANEILSNQTNRILVNELMEHIEFEDYKVCSDELIWATLFGNSEVMNVTGAFDAADFLKKHIDLKYEYSMRRRANKLLISKVEPFIPRSPHIGRYQIWDYRRCKGKMYHGSCIFGVEDLAILTTRAELVAHKLYSEFEPAAQACLRQHVRKREQSPEQRLFRGENYQMLPLVQLRNGKSLQDQFYSFIHKKKRI